MNLLEFNKSLRELNSAEKFEETLSYFKQNKIAFTTEQIGSNKYIVSAMIIALIETNNYDAIFPFINRYKVVFEGDSFCYLLKAFKDKPSINWKVLNEFCDLVSVDNLSIICNTIEVTFKGAKKTIELASEKEEWFAAKTKALFELEDFEHCFELSKKALGGIEKFHYSNDVWFARRIALSKKSLGNPSDALKELLQIVEKKREWYIYSEIAEIYFEKGDVENAFKYAMNGINGYGDIEYKVGLILLMGDILLKKQNTELAFKHYMLSKLLRIDEQWRVPSILETKIRGFGKLQLEISNLNALKQELKQYWRNSSDNALKYKIPRPNGTFQIGEISKVLNNNERGADGFIKYNDDSIYFKIYPNDKLISKLKVGLKVKFKIASPKFEGQKSRAIGVVENIL